MWAVSGIQASQGPPVVLGASSKSLPQPRMSACASFAAASAPGPHLLSPSALGFFQFLGTLTAPEPLHIPVDYPGLPVPSWLWD